MQWNEHPFYFILDINNITRLKSINAFRLIPNSQFTALSKKSLFWQTALSNAKVHMFEKAARLDFSLLCMLLMVADESLFPPTGNLFLFGPDEDLTLPVSGTRAEGFWLCIICKSEKLLEGREL